MKTRIEEARTQALTWISAKAIDAETKYTVNELLQAGNEKELIDCFYQKITFGTGGLRGIMGVGTNRINQYTLGIATQGLAYYLIKKKSTKAIHVAIAYDSRHHSRDYANIVARIFSSNGIEVHLFLRPTPTPILSFAVRHLACHAGIVITASHNPKEYNGYKVYGADGAQLVPPDDQAVIDEVNNIPSIDEVDFDGNDTLVTLITHEVEEAYYECVKNLVEQEQNLIKRHKNMSMVYSALHGAGGIAVEECLTRIGFNACVVVPEQHNPDGDFPTVTSPNPEHPHAMKKALELAKKNNADLLMITDPDVDRVGIGIRKDDGTFLLLNGNQALCLLMNYKLKTMKNRQGGYLVTTLVTTELADQLAKKWDVPCYHTPTGFKYIAEQIRKREKTESFIAAGEESYGYLVGDFVRDKDAVSACALFATMAAVANDQKQTLYDELIQLYLDHGLYHEDLVTCTLEGVEGAQQIERIMHMLRNQPPTSVGDEKIVRIVDLMTQKETSPTGLKPLPTSLPKLNMLQFYTNKGSKLSVRPSGTEPTIKFYFGVKTTLTSKSTYEPTLTRLKEQITRLKKTFIPSHLLSLLALTIEFNSIIIVPLSP